MSPGVPLPVCKTSYPSTPECCMYIYVYIGPEGVSHYIVTRNPDGSICGETVNQTFDGVSHNNSLLTDMFHHSMQVISSVTIQSGTPGKINLPCKQTVQVY